MYEVPVRAINILTETLIEKLFNPVVKSTLLVAKRRTRQRSAAEVETTLFRMVSLLLAAKAMVFKRVNNFLCPPRLIRRFFYVNGLLVFVIGRTSVTFHCRHLNQPVGHFILHNVVDSSSFRLGGGGILGRPIYNRLPALFHDAKGDGGQQRLKGVELGHT